MNIEELNRQITSGYLDRNAQPIREAEVVRSNFYHEHFSRVASFYEYHGVATTQEIAMQLARTSRLCRTVKG